MTDTITNQIIFIYITRTYATISCKYEIVYYPSCRHNFEFRNSQWLSLFSAFFSTFFLYLLFFLPFFFFPILSIHTSFFLYQPVCRTVPPSPSLFLFLSIPHSFFFYFSLSISLHLPPLCLFLFSATLFFLTVQVVRTVCSIQRC